MKKTENTLENKAKFLAQYWGQNILMSPVLDGVQRSKVVGAIEDYVKKSSLELTPLSEITDEDAIECAKLIYGNYHIEETFGVLSSKKALFEIHKSINDTRHFIKNDYLRSKGYALPWLDLSVQNLIEYGWIKLKLKQ